MIIAEVYSLNNVNYNFQIHTSTNITNKVYISLFDCTLLDGNICLSVVE